MDVNTPDGGQITLSPQNLRTVFDYSLQHRVVIAKAMHRALPELWPTERVDEHTFYELLHVSLQDPTKLECLLTTLFALALRKGKSKWDAVLNLPLRVLTVALNNFEDPDDVQEVLRNDNYEELFSRLSENGYPEFGWIDQWFQVNWPEATDTDKVEEECGKTFSAVTNADTLTQDWHDALIELAAVATDATEKCPDRNTFEALETELVHLNDVVSQYETLATAIPQPLQDRAKAVIANLILDDDERVRDEATAVKSALESYSGTPDQLSEWCNRIEVVNSDLVQARSELVTRAEAVRSAFEVSDYATVHQQSALAQRAEAAMADTLNHVLDVLRDLSGHPSPEISQTEPLPVVDTREPMEAVEVSDAISITSATMAPPTGMQVQTPTVPEAGTFDDTVPVVVEKPSQTDDELQGEPESAAILREKPEESPSETSKFDVEDWPPDVPTETLAAMLPDASEPEQVCLARTLAWALIRDDRIPLAYHFAAAATQLAPPQAGELLPEPIRAIHLARHLHTGAGDEVVELATTLNFLLAGGLADEMQRKDRANAALMFAATIRPALLAPDTSGARTVLRNLHLDDQFSRLHELREFILSPGFYFRALIKEGESGKWEKRLKSLQERCRSWWEDNRHRTYKYSPATVLWRHFLEDDGGLGRVFSMITENRVEAIDEAKSVIAVLQNRTRVSAWLDEVDVSLRHNVAGRKPIEAGPRTDMIRRCADVAKLLAEWVNLVEACPAQQQRGRQEVSSGARDHFLGLISEARGQLQEIEGNGNLSLSAAALAAYRALDDLQNFFRAEATIPSVKAPWWQALNADLLHVQGLSLDETDWSPRWDHFSGPEPLVALLAAITPPPWPESFSLAAERCDHTTTWRIVEWLRAPPLSMAQTDIDRLEADRERGLHRCRKTLATLIEKTRDEIERAVGYGYLGESERLELTSRLADVANSETDDIESLEQRLDTIAEFVTDSRERYIGEIRNRLKGIAIPDTYPDNMLGRIDQLLESGDILTANEYVALLESGQSLPAAADSRDAFAAEFFPGFVEAVNDGLMNPRDGGGGARKVLEAVESGKSIGPLDMREVPGSQTKTAAAMLRAWLELKSRRGDPTERLQDFLENLGFRVRNLSRSHPAARDSGQAWYELETQPIADRDVCIVPRYGSAAAGHYRVLCLWQRPSEDEVLTATHAGPGTHPVFVLYLGHLSPKRRRDLAFRSRERRQTLLLLDESLVYFLCGERGSRLPTLFNCTFPFTIAQPYVSTSSDVPSELFFGRKREREAIYDLAGTNLVFGGRQLGKTALLRDVVRRHHEPQRGCIVVWIDLKEHHIGITRPAASVWQVIDRALQQESVLPRRDRVAESTADAIREWLDAGMERRIVVLLDEADAFLSQDSRDNHYQTVGTLKGLMERTQRRFKIVFAGLHDVQRASRDINTPLAHLGTPVCIGPLLDNGEVREAYQLVQQPFLQLGYRFASPDLISRILSHTNYYPNLIQIFCTHLLEYLNDNSSGRFNPSIAPPYEVTSEHIENASRRADLQRIIRQRFQITLDLDNRYQVLALVIALETVDRREQSLDSSEGFDVGWIRENALVWWERGFEDRSFDAFRTLLDEMVGLGVLRRTGSGLRLYALRSPAIASLLGTRSDIEHTLDDASKKAPPAVYEAGTFRRTLPGDHWLRSPLSGQQESDILATESGVTVLFGSRLAGLVDVERFLRASANEKTYVSFVQLADLEDRQTFCTKLKSEITNHQGNGTQLIMLPEHQFWTADWVSDALQIVSRHRGKKLLRRVLFVGDPNAAWAWTDPAIPTPDKPGLTVMSLSPWAPSSLRLWVTDAGFGPCGESELHEFQEATGLWSGLLSRLAGHIRQDSIQWRRGLEQFIEEAHGDSYTEFIDDIPPEVHPVLDALSAYGDGITPEELCELLGGRPLAYIQRVIRWGDMLGFVQPEGGGRWHIDPVVGHILGH